MRHVSQTQASKSRRGLLSRLSADQGGSTILEFAFVVGPFIALILAILQTALIFFANQLLDTATQAATRLVITGEVQTYPGHPGMTKTEFETAVCARLKLGAKFFDCSNLTIDVSIVGTTNGAFSTANTAAPTITYVAGKPTMPNRYDTGGVGNIVMVRLTYPWNVVGAPGLDMTSMTNGQFLLMATTISRTEPYI